jgi:hypothetical protein
MKKLFFLYSRIMNAIVYVAMFALLSSCVGTIKDKNALNSTTQSIANTKLANIFKGLQSAKAVAHDKVELVFTPVEGDPATLSYEVYINNSSIPIKISGNSLEASKTIDQNYLYTVTGLTLKTIYNFNMRVVVAGTTTSALSLDPNKSISVETFANETADFMGVSSLVLGSGNSAVNSVTVNWIPATIKGTSLNIRPTDPVAYEIIYWMSGDPKNVIQVPSSYANPVLNRDSSYTVTNLVAGTNYFFQVRAIQKSYALNISTDPLFKRELNSRVMQLATLAVVPTDLSFITNGNLFLTNPITEKGRTELNVNWSPAWGNGGFFSYRVYYQKIDLGLLQHLTDQFGDLSNLDPSAQVANVDASLTNFTLTNLDPKAHYQVKVYVCASPLPASGCAVSTSFKYAQIRPPLSPFAGILKITNPTSVTALDRVTLNFEAPDTNNGFLNKFNIYCHNPTDLSQKILIPSNGVATSAATGITNCNTTSVAPFSSGSFPATIDEFNVFTKVSIKLKQNANGVDSFCFSLAPAISYADIPSSVLDDELDNPVVKCITPNALAPTMAEFPGREDACNISGDSMTITWPQPTGGIYSNFILFYKEKTSSNDVFNFPNAITDHYGTTNLGYQSVLMDGVTFTKKITGLVEGKSYFAGVLTYRIDPNDATKKIFSNYNSRTGECRFPTPSPIFNEWVDLMALGPKEDGLAVGLNSAAANLYEKLDTNGAPIETAATSEEVTTAAFDGGVARTTTSGPVKYFKNSSSGIVKLVWKDITFTNGLTMANFIINSGEQGISDRSLRNYGYKVYRSEDNRQSWVDLTATGPVYPDDLSASPSAITSYAKNNGVQTPIYERLNSFIDYSVENISVSSTADVDRARVYWYKVIPYYLKKEQTYYTTNNNEHHIIRVTLPPKNMALVHRLIANRTVCLELQKSINKKAGAYYSCNYNGLGASGLAYPWQKGNTVYDAGGDLLVDRFELGCGFTRGAEDGSSINPAVSSSATLKNADMDGFKGCLNIGQSAYEPYQNSSVPANSSGTYRAHQVVAGDCFGKDLSVTSYIGENPLFLCGSAKKDYYGRFSYPGSKPVEVPCSDVDDSNEFLNFPHFPGSAYYTNVADDNFPTQSEVGAVYYNRAGHLDNWEYSSTLIYKGALSVAEVSAGKIAKTLSYGGGGVEKGVARRSSCQMNLGYKDGAKYIPRWVPVSALMGSLTARAVNNDGTRDTGVALKLSNKKMSEVLANPNLYNDQMVAPPSRFSNALPLSRLFSSNSSKLPPLDGMSQTDLAEICGTYKVEVGIKKGTENFVTLSAPKSKRIIRKKESTVTGAWASKYSETDITNLERNQCNGGNRNQTGTANVNNANLISPLFPNASLTGAAVITGSSSADGAGHTQSCVSKFGVQDIVGNFWEVNSEEIFCDYRPEKSAQLYIGDYRGGVAAAGIDKTKSVIYRGDGRWFDSSTSGGVLTTQAVRVMVEENIDNRSGSCSIVDKRVDDGTYLSGNSIIPIIKTDGTLNTSLVLTQKNQDQESVNTLRNGDGSFLTFGKDKVAMALDKNNKIASFSLFNPAVGMPILCGSSAGCEVNSDNQFVKNNVALGNSAFSSMGVSEVGIGVLAGGTPSTDLRINYINKWFISQFINTTGILPYPGDPANTVEYPMTNVAPMSTTYPTPTEISYANWTVPRDLNTGDSGATIRMYTGGSANSQSGRYSLKLEGYSEVDERFSTRMAGGRCVILINNE